MNTQPETPEPADPVPGADAHRPAALPHLPPGSQLLSADEAVDILVSGNHPDAARGTLTLDAALVEALRAGWIVACRLPNGQLALTRIAEPAGSTPTA